MGTHNTSKSLRGLGTQLYSAASPNQVIKINAYRASASHRAFTLQATGVAMANATYMFMRENSRFEMMRAVGAKAVASVEMAVLPTMVAGEQNAEISEGETSGEDFSDGDFTDIDEQPHSGSKPRDEWVNASKQSSKYFRRRPVTGGERARICVYLGT